MRLVWLSLLFLFVGIASCTREESFEVGAAARGSLQSSTTGECLTKIVVGSFVAGKALTDSNYLDVDVDVATLGAYTIKTTDTVNGYSFSGSGNFTKTGINRIRLAAIGTPLAAREDLFTVQFDTSFCEVSVTVLPEGSNSGPAVFTLLGLGDNCMDAEVKGDYAVGVALDGSNTVAIKVNVTTAGTYTLTTTTVNGFQFSRTATVSSTGDQIITLVGSGTPTADGAAVFSIAAGSTSCNFTVNVLKGETPPPPTNSTDLFPLSTNSWWSYVLDVTSPQDSFTVFSVGSVLIAGKTYQQLQLRDIDDEPYDSAYYRKGATDYYKFVALTATNIPGLEADVNAEVVFLRDNPAAGDSWSNEGDIKVNGVDAKVRLSYTCTEANITTTVNGQSFSGVYKVTGKLQAGPEGNLMDISEEEVYYARGIGLIYQKATGGNTGDFERHIKSWSVK
jgi:hypothetical protein